MKRFCTQCLSKSPLKAFTELALTTSYGKEFQTLTIRKPKTLALIDFLQSRFNSFKLWVRVRVRVRVRRSNGRRE